MTSRRRFLMAGGAAAGACSILRVWASKITRSEFPFDEFEERVARRDFRDITKDILPTPCMVVDIDMFQANVKHMADTAKANGINVRPHVKVHKSVDVAKHQVANGAIGLTCATIAEAELFSRAGIKGVLWTKQPASINNIQRAVALSKKDPTFMFVADDPQVVDWVEEAAAAHNHGLLYPFLAPAGTLPRLSLCTLPTGRRHGSGRSCLGHCRLGHDRAICQGASGLHAHQLDAATHRAC